MILVTETKVEAYANENECDGRFDPNQGLL